MWIKLVELQMSLSTFTMRQWTKEEGYVAVLTIVRTVLALLFAFLTVVTQKAPERWLPCAVLALVGQGSCFSGCPAEDFVLLCSLAVKGAVQKVPQASHDPSSVGVELCRTGTGLDQYREAELALFSLEARI